VHLEDQEIRNKLFAGSTWTLTSQQEEETVTCVTRDPLDFVLLFQFHVYNPLLLPNAIIRMALAQRLNELAVANSEGLLKYVLIFDPF
jgi:hypothetical protein